MSGQFSPLHAPLPLRDYCVRCSTNIYLIYCFECMLNILCAVVNFCVLLIFVTKNMEDKILEGLEDLGLASD